MRRINQTPARGFSILELVMVLAIIGVVTAMAQPKLATYVENERVRTVSRRLELDLSLARSEAIKKRTDVTVRFDPSGKFYEIVGIDNVATVDGIQATYRVNIMDRGGRDAHILSADFGGDAELSFNSLGMPDSTGYVMIDSGRSSCAVVVDTAGGEIERILHTGDDPMSVTVGGEVKIVATKKTGAQLAIAD